MFNRKWDSEDYKRFLKSPEWNRKAWQVKQRSKYHCENCRDYAKHCGAVHHLTYKERNDVESDWCQGWLPPISYLVYLCCDCHALIHGKGYYDPLNPPSWAEMKKGFDAL